MSLWFFFVSSLSLLTSFSLQGTIFLFLSKTQSPYFNAQSPNWLAPLGIVPHIYICAHICTHVPPSIYPPSPLLPVSYHEWHSHGDYPLLTEFTLGLASLDRLSFTHLFNLFSSPLGFRYCPSDFPGSELTAQDPLPATPPTLALAYPSSRHLRSQPNSYHPIPILLALKGRMDTADCSRTPWFTLLSLEAGLPYLTLTSRVQTYISHEDLKSDSLYNK